MKEPHAATFKLFGHTIQLTSAARFSGRLTSNPPIPPPSFQETPTKEEGAESDQDTEPSSSPSNNEGNEPSSSKSESEKQQEETEPGKEEKAPEGGPAINRWVPCPRCESSDTKFCYFNNYNVSQPRHFCRRCQRYWTNGGNQRNLPIGSGRRKRKTKRPDTSLSDKILSGLYRSSSSSTSSSPSPSSFVISSSACYGTEDLDLHGLNGLLAWPNGRILP